MNRSQNEEERKKISVSEATHRKKLHLTFTICNTRYTRISFIIDLNMLIASMWYTTLFDIKDSTEKSQ